MMNVKKIKKSVRYAHFHITNAAAKYTLHVNGYTGTLTDALKYLNRKKFSTFYSNNDSHSTKNSASRLSGDWSFVDCHATHFNGKYYSGGKMDIGANKEVNLIYDGIHCYSDGFNVFADSLIFTEMKLRRRL